MSNEVNKYTFNIIDGKTGQKRTANSLIESGGWYFKQVNQFSLGSPLSVLENTRVKLTIPENDEGFETGRFFDLSYDYDAQKFLPQTVGDVYMVNIRYKAQTPNLSGFLTIDIEIPNANFNPIAAETTRFLLGTNTEQFKSFQTTIFIGPEAVQDGIEVYASSINANISVYDYSFTIVRLFSNK